MDATPGTAPTRGCGSEFGTRTVDFACETLQADWGCFYLLDDEAEPYTFCAHGVPKELPRAYIERNMRHCDPLHPRHLKPQDRRRFVLLNDSTLQFPAEQRHRYWRFLNSFGVRHTGEMVFRHQGVPVAGLSLMWRRKTGQPEGAGFGMSVHSYVEFNLNSQLNSKQIPEARLPIDLTQRQREVVQLACSGCSNAEIARQLNIGVATVKTHLINIFEKAGVSNRAALVNRMLTRTHLVPALA
jgi:DNA-binding CsgD family transcriptional regulator